MAGARPIGVEMARLGPAEGPSVSPPIQQLEPSAKLAAAKQSTAMTSVTEGPREVRTTILFIVVLLAVIALVLLAGQH
jgi:hypothetical protein